MLNEYNLNGANFYRRDKYALNMHWICDPWLSMIEEDPTIWVTCGNVKAEPHYENSI